MPLLGRDIVVSGPLPQGSLLLETFTGTETLGLCYKFELGLLSENADIDVDDVLGQPLSIGIKLSSGKERFFHGIVQDFFKSGNTKRYARYMAVLVPSLSQFDHTRDCRIFNQPGQTALSIVSEVLAQRGLTDVEAGSVKDHRYRAREYCVQYRESDFDFVQRLLEEEGIYYFFKHEEAKDTLVLADSGSGHSKAEHYDLVPYFPKERRAAGMEEHFWSLRLQRSLSPGRYSILAGYDPTALRRKQPYWGDQGSGESAPGPQFEFYDYPGGLSDPDEASQEAVLRAQTAAVAGSIIEVEGNTLGLGAGHLVSLRPGPSADGIILPFWNEDDFANQYLVVSANYSIRIDQYETGDVVGADEPFKATYTLWDSKIPFRPQRTTSKPRMTGSQTALVVGPAGEEIWTDPEGLGRVMVQFDWDRLGEHNEKSSCWIRVAQMWAGANWGAIHIPRIGQEVIVDFLDGDPDRPLITGRLYNADNTPPYDLPGNRTQSGIKSRSSKGGTGNNFNELRFEDLKGKEELHLQAERDMSTLVKHNQTLAVGVDRSIEVGNDEDTVIKGDRTTTVGTDKAQNKDDVVINGSHKKTVMGPVTQIYADDHFRKVDGDQTLAVEKNKNEHVKLAYTLTTDERFQLIQAATTMTFEGTNVTVDSAGMITMKAGGAMATIDQAGMITLNSPTAINLLCGGSGLSILPGGIAIAAAAVTAAAGGGASTMEMGKEKVVMKSKTVSIEAETTCTIKGKSVLKLNSP
jgi:type VI secretion system secreted protein VgrG